MENKITAVRRMYRHLDRRVSVFKRRSGLACVKDCGMCCLTGELNATVLEFLPAAYELYLKGVSDSILEQISNKEDTICTFYSPFSPGANCTQYEHRGLICRLFGYSVRTDKNGSANLVTCHPIKSSMVYPPSAALLEKAPNLSSYYLRLYGIDPLLATRYLPINQAIREAIEQVLFYYSFRKRPA